MASSLLSFVITIVLVALGAAASGKGKMKKARKFIPPNPAWRNGQPGQTAPMQQAWANRPPIPQGQPVQQRVNQQPSQGQMRAYQKQMAMDMDKDRCRPHRAAVYPKTSRPQKEQWKCDLRPCTP